MGGRGIPHLINGLHGRIDCGVKAYGIICTGNIQINGTRKANGVDPLSGKRLGAPVGTVSADHHKAVDPMLSADLRTLLLSFLCFKFRTAGCT